MIKSLITFLIILGPLLAKADVVNVTTKAQYDEVVNLVKPIVIMFGAPWCPYCVEAKPAFIAAEKLYKGKVIFVYMNTDIVQIQGIPYLPSYVMGDITGDFRNNTMNMNKGRSVSDLVEYIKEFHHIEP